jgi:hypothetical protein
VGGPRGTTSATTDVEYGSAALGRSPLGRVCVVTGAPARYIDPHTQQPYASLAAFRILRAHPTPA